MKFKTSRDRVWRAGGGWLAMPCRLIPAALLFAVFTLCFACAAIAGDARSGSVNRAKSANKIAFLHLKLMADLVQVLEIKVVPGHLKDSLEPAGDRISLQVVSLSGEFLWEGWIADPRLQHLEWEDPNNPGHLLSKMVVQENPEFMVRIPFVEARQSVRVARVSVDATGKVSSQFMGVVEVREQ